MVSVRKVIVGVMYVLIAALLGYYGRAAAKPTPAPTPVPVPPPAPVGQCTGGAQCTTPGQFCYNGTCQGPSGTCAPACVIPQQCVNGACVTPLA
jgi:hypothetical protein